MMKFRFISDPGHGWLEVPMTLLESLDVQKKISQFSYRKGDMAYLEEDCDAPVLIKALKDKSIQYVFTEVYQERTRIRNYERFVNA